MPTVMVTFVQATFILETFVLATFVTAITDLLTQFWPNFFDPILAGPNFLDQKLFGPKFCLTLTFVDLQTFFYPKFFWTQNFVDLRFCGPKIVFHPNFFGSKFFCNIYWRIFFLFWILLTPNFFTNIFFDPIFSHPVLFLRGYTYKLP